MSTFALVHGAWHQASCWDALGSELRTLGHDVVAMDLPSEDPAATFSDYADAVVRSLEGAGDDVIVVGHSLAGHTIPLVAARRPVRALVYVCALVAVPGLSFVDQLGEGVPILLPGYEQGLRVDSAGRRVWSDEAIARHTFYADCPPDVAAAAWRALRPQSAVPYAIRCPLTAQPQVPTTYVLCEQDHLVNPEWSRTAAIDILGADLVELPGGHSPFLSRPAALAAVLHERCAG